MSNFFQIYKRDTSSYTSFDKFHGRKLTDNTFKQALTTFLDNGIRSRTELLEPIVFQLSKLIACLETVYTYRFYASSLLIIYDGEEVAQTLADTTRGASATPRKNGLNFPHLVKKADTSQIPSPFHSEENSLSNVNNDVKNAQQSAGKSDIGLNDAQTYSVSDSISNPQPSSIPPHKTNVEHQQHQQSTLSSSSSSSSSSLSSCPNVKDSQRTNSPSQYKVDVKMIDFAHTTHKGFTSDRVHHQGPDQDYINGLVNLRELFKQILNA